MRKFDNDTLNKLFDTFAGMVWRMDGDVFRLMSAGFEKEEIEILFRELTGR